MDIKTAILVDEGIRGALHSRIQKKQQSGVKYT